MCTTPLSRFSSLAGAKLCGLIVADDVSRGFAEHLLNAEIKSYDTCVFSFRL